MKVLWAYLLVSSPYLLFGLLFSGLIHKFVPMSKVKKWLGRDSFSSVLKASLVGVPLPLCSCSVIPTAVTLKKAGASNGATSAFLISTPESGVDSISITYALIDLPMTLIRPLAAFCSAFFAGALQFMFNDFEYKEEINQEAPAKSSCCSKKKETPKETPVELFKGVFKYGYGKLINDISVWLTIGILLGALIEFVVPDNFFTSMGMIENRIMILLIGVPLYICASASTPIAVSLMLKGLSPGSALLLLLVGPATNISNIAVLQKYIGKKGVALNVFSIVFVALIFSFITDYMYAHFFKLQLSEMLQHHDHGGAWWEVISAIILVILLSKGIYKEEIKPRLKGNKPSACGSK
ncbi:MAG: uncharacterized membrane protein YraQ (UPF0718 family) [Bacteriovoracaceae bacterium]|jgi:uncharacterized membrane protein YraQ (UPF0718 family)